MEIYKLHKDIDESELIQNLADIYFLDYGCNPSSSAIVAADQFESEKGNIFYFLEDQGNIVSYSEVSIPNINTIGDLKNHFNSKFVTDVNGDLLEIAKDYSIPFGGDNFYVENIESYVQNKGYASKLLDYIDDDLNGSMFLFPAHKRLDSFYSKRGFVESGFFVRNRGFFSHKDNYRPVLYK